MVVPDNVKETLMIDKNAPEEMICEKCGGLRGMEYVDPKTGEEFYDHCLDKLPGVIQACCGHGGEGFILFKSGVMVRFKDATVERRSL